MPKFYPQPKGTQFHSVQRSFTGSASVTEREGNKTLKKLIPLLPKIQAHSPKGQGKNNVTNLLPYLLNPLFPLKKAAFTLAEVLITLGIIGVVAAMTIPTLMTNYKKHVVATRLARTYSIITQAIRLAEENYGEGFTVDLLKDEGELPEGDVNGYSWELSHMAFEKFFKPGIKTIHTYTKEQMSSLTMYFGSTKVNRTSFAWYDLLDGTRLGYNQPGNYTGLTFIAIPNPHKAKIIGGVDAFLIQFRAVNGSYEPYCAWHTYYQNGTMTREKVIEYCASDVAYPAYASPPDSFCFKLIKDNGLKIPGDYPLKF